MKFDDFITKGMVRKASIDEQLIKSITETSELDLRFLDGLKIDKLSSRKIFTNYYDVLRSILEACALKAGYKVYSHEAFTFFLKDGREEELAKKFDRFRHIRNKINYYGKDISPEEVAQYKTDIIKLINEIKSKLK